MKNSNKSQIEKLNQKLDSPKDNEKFVLELLLQVMRIRAEFLDNCLQKYNLQIQLLSERFYRNELTPDMLTTYQQSLLRDLDKARSQVSGDFTNIEFCEDYIKQIISAENQLGDKCR